MLKKNIERTELDAIESYGRREVQHLVGVRALRLAVRAKMRCCAVEKGDAGTSNNGWGTIFKRNASTSQRGGDTLKVEVLGG